jgi:5-methyltetrahydropteroyltriglutamate--homocysteine methyltransferase
MPLPKGVYRADHVGSWLRPKPLLAARGEHAEGKRTAEDLRKLEDGYIAEVVKDQLQAGMQSITDGEFRRAIFHLDFLKHLDGVEIQGTIDSTGKTKTEWKVPKLVVSGKLGHSKAIQVDDFNFLQGQLAAEGAEGKATAKVCIPSPTMVHFRGSRDSINKEAYPTLEPFFEDLARVYQEELQDLYDAGCRFVQLDDTNLAYLCDQGMRKEAETRHGEDGDKILQQYAALINAAISKRPKDLTIGIHLCRGNYRSQWFAQGGYEAVAEVLFKDLNVDVYFLEYDDARSGDFSPLRHLPEHKIVVLGVISTKHGRLEDKTEIIRRLNEAATYCPRGLDQLCLSGQCGYSSTSEGNELTPEQQWAKVRQEVEIAKEVWGEDLAA